MKIPTLAAYSAASGLLLGLASEASGQMTYYNIDPDANVYGDMDYPIDLNFDGMPEMIMHANKWWTFTDDGVFSTQHIHFLPYAEIASSAGPLQLYAGDTVDADLDFNSSNQTFFYGYNHNGAIDLDIGASWINNDSYIGLRFEVGGNTHYGWVRVRLHQAAADDLPWLIVKELAWNATPDAPAPINLHVGTAQFPTLADVGESNTAADLQLHFEKPDDESNVVVYRVILYSGYDDPTLAEANAVAAERYTQVLPTGEDITINFNETTLDINGNPLISGTYYQAIILSIPDGIIVTGRDLSLPSNSMYYILREAPVAEDVDLIATGFEDDITGFYGNFYMASTSVSAVRAIISDSYLDLEELLVLAPEYYTEFMPALGSNTVYFTTDKLVYTSGTPALFEGYYLNILSLPDGLTTSFPNTEYEVSHFCFQNYYAEPIVTIIDTTATGADIQVQFPMFANEALLHNYCIFVAKADAVIYPEDVYDLSSAERLDVTPTGNDIDINLDNLIFDTDGVSIKSNEAYKVYVALKGDFYPECYSLASPSVEFILGADADQNSNSLPNIWIENLANALLHIQLPTSASAQIKVVNTAGIIVYENELTAAETVVDLNFLPAGMYIAYVTTKQVITNYKFAIVK